MHSFNIICMVTRKLFCICCFFCFLIFLKNNIISQVSLLDFLGFPYFEKEGRESNPQFEKNFFNRMSLLRLLKSMVQIPWSFYAG